MCSSRHGPKPRQGEGRRWAIAASARVVPTLPGPCLGTAGAQPSPHPPTSASLKKSCIASRLIPGACCSTGFRSQARRRVEFVPGERDSGEPVRRGADWPAKPASLDPRDLLPRDIGSSQLLCKMTRRKEFNSSPCFLLNRTALWNKFCFSFLTDSLFC